MKERMIDLRSDTVTRPTEAMRRAMYEAEVGDDVFGEDPTVNRLQAMAARLSGHEAALFMASGTQSNLVALLTHCQRGEEYIVGQQAHTYRYEAGGAAVLGGIQPQPIDFEDDGSLDLEKVDAAIKPDDVHFARTRLLALENTVGGKVLPMAYVSEAIRFAREKGLSIHLDGARVCNAAVALGLPVKAITAGFDSVSLCLSKGLGAPVGSVLCGSRALVSEALRWRKIVGGGMRQSGVLAAAGIYALEHNIQRMEEDHRHARQLAEGLESIDALRVDKPSLRTNMVFVRLPEEDLGPLTAVARDARILLGSVNPMRLVTHLEIESGDITRVIRLFHDYFSEKRRSRTVRRT